MGPLAVDDVLPPMISSLLSSAPLLGVGMEFVTLDPFESDRAARPLRGFECSIARMLDGRRTAREVLENCSALGLPVSLRTLERFLVRLKQQGFLEVDGPPIAVSGSGRVRHRERWSLEVRDHYRAALRAAREDRLGAALRHLDAALISSPRLPEAQRLKSWVGGRARATAR